MEEKEAVINAVREHPILWDFTHPNYKNVGRTEQAWEAVSNTVGISVKEAKAKWKNLRDTWIRRKREYEEDGPSGSATQKEPPTWPYWEMMGFLRGIGTNRGTTENTSTNDDVDDVEIVQPRKKTKQAPKKNDRYMQIFEEATTRMRSFAQQADQEDADDAFGHSVAMALKDLDLPHKIQARTDIQSVLAKHQLEQHAQNSPSRRRIIRPWTSTPKKGGCSPKGRANHPSSP